MSNLKNQLIKLGSKNKDLRPHIRSILANLEKSSQKIDLKKLDLDTTNTLRKLIKKAYKAAQRIAKKYPEEFELMQMGNRHTLNLTDTGIQKKLMEHLKNNSFVDVGRMFDNVDWASDVIAELFRSDAMYEALRAINPNVRSSGEDRKRLMADIVNSLSRDKDVAKFIGSVYSMRSPLEILS